MIENIKKYDYIKTYLIFIIALLAAIYHLYTGGFGYASVRDLRIIHWLSMSTLVFLLYPTIKSKPNSRISKTIDMIFFVFAFACGIYILFNWRSIVIVRGELLNNLDVFFGILATIVVLEAIRRVIGWFLLSVTFISVIYFFAGSLITSSFGHRAFSLSYVSSLLYVSTSGIYGLPLGVSAKYIVLFIIFAAILRGVRGDILFNDLANSLVGHLVGGTAKVAVVSSAFFGAVSGSAAANVATTGSFTIPAMKKVGYSPRMAGAIESVASTAGQITPPILGVAAFLIAELIGIDYVLICAASLMPAILYYLITYIVIHNYSINLGILGIVEKSKRPRLLKVFADRGHLMGSFGVFIYLIVRGYSPMFSIFWGLVSLFCISMLKANTRMNIKQILFSLTEGVKDTIPIATACAAAGIISSSLLATGLGLSFSSVVLSYTQNSLILTLLFTMVATLILGCGMPTTPAYIIVSVITVQTLLKFGNISALQAHFFIFYFAVLSTITLPVALSCYVASGIAKESPIKIGISAMILAAGVFFLPYLFIYKRGLLMVGSTHEIFLDIISSTTIMICIAFFSSQLLSRKPREQEIELYKRIIQTISILSIIVIVLILPSFVPYTSILSTILNVAAFITSIGLSFVFFQKKKAEMIQ